MNTTEWTLRLGMRVAVVGAAMLAISACRDANKSEAATTTSTSPPATGGDHSKEEFCKTMVKQFELLSKVDPSDMAKRPKYFADQKDLNATLVKTAPASLASDVALQTKNANAMNDAQASLDTAKIKAAAATLRSPEHLAAARRMNEYCGTTATVAH